MRKKIVGLLLAFCLTGTLAMEAHGEELYGRDDWKVTFTAQNEMVSNFGQGDLDDAVSGMEPGDSIVLTLSLKNENQEAATDWYMTNKVLYSLEDRSANTGTTGGAYTYELIYTNRNGVENVLFTSDTVGGEFGEESGIDSESAGEGLHAATSALEDYFYLDTLNPSQGGTITLRIVLDGETQGNDYQDTLADLQMNFAVEVQPGPVTVEETPPPGNPDEPDNPNNPTSPPSSGTTVVKTGDETNLSPYFAAMAASGVLFLILGLYGVKQNRKEKKGDA